MYVYIYIYICVYSYSHLLCIYIYINHIKYIYIYAHVCIHTHVYHAYPGNTPGISQGHMVCYFRPGKHAGLETLQLKSWKTPERSGAMGNHHGGLNGGLAIKKWRYL